MMRYCILFICSLFSINGIAQKYGNEWIAFGQGYYKIKVLENGFHKVSYQALKNGGVPVDAIDPQELQLWYRGNQLSIEIKGEKDGVFNEADAMVFYGKVADGKLETPLYYKPEFQQHTSYSLYSDTSYYYLTWKEGEKGKRVVEETAITTTKVKFVKSIKEMIFTDIYSLGNQAVDLIFKSEVDDGEGWVSNSFGYNPKTPTLNFKEFIFDDLEGVKSNSDMSLELGLVGMNGLLHRVEIQTGNTTVKVPDFRAYVNQDVKTTISSNQIESGQLKVKISSFGDGTSNDLIAVSFIRLTYQNQLKTLSFNEQNFVEAEGKLAVKNILSASVYHKAGETFVGQLKTAVVGDSLVVDLSANSIGNELLFLTDTSYKTIHSIKKTEGFVNDLVDADYLMLTHKLFMEGALQYEAYRESVEGGEYNVHLVELERIFDQYMYGEKNPLAIRNMFRYLIDNNQKPDFFLIVGSGVKHNIKYYGVPYARKLPFAARKNNGTLYYPIQDYILTYGDPGWDIGFTAGLDGEDELSPAVPTSRIPSTTNQHVINYLNKVKEFENPSNVGLWRKRFIHLSGGQTTSQQRLFQNLVGQYTSVAEQPYMGAKVTSFSKKSDEAVQFFNVSKEVNAGVGMIAYLGHSSPLFLEIDLGLASDEANGYKNKGKYPLLYFNGCYSGDLFQQYSKAQDWVNAADKGAIGAFAHNAYGYTSQLHDYTLTFYLEAYADSNNLNLPIGLLHKKVINAYLNGKNRGDIVRSQAQLLSLIGDPAVRVFPYKNPDYLVEKAKISSFDGERVTAVKDTFLLDLVISNYGIVDSEPFTICVERQVNQGQFTIEYGPFTVNPISYQDTIQVIITSDSTNWGGLNLFKVKIDCDDSLPEDNKSNNLYSFSYILPTNGVKTLFPKEFSIVSDSVIKLQAQAYDLTIDSTWYDFQIDTSITFVNPIDVFQIKSKATVKMETYQLPIVTDTTVYYWRVKLKTDSIWEKSSFTYIKNTQGVGQFELNQFYKNTLNGVFKNKEANKWAFDTSQINIKLLSAGAGLSGYANKVYLKINDQALMLRAGEANCGTNNLFLLAFDKQTALPFNPSGIATGNCGADPMTIFTQNRLDLDARQLNVISYLNKLEEGDYVLIYTVGNPRLGQLGDSLKNVIRSYGATLLDSLPNEVPYVFLGKKGGVKLFEEFGKTKTDTIALNYNLNGRVDRGTVWSPLIGPASKWNTFQDNFLLEGKDEVTVDIYGVRFDFTDSLIYSLSSAENHFLSLDSLGIDEAIFPYLKTKSSFLDSINFTAPQLNYWSISYAGVPEGTLVFNDQEEGDVEELFEGNTYSHSFLFANVSENDFLDSLTVEFQLIGERETQIWTKKIPAVLAGDTSIFSVDFNTVGWSGVNQLQVFVNPYLQLEEDYTNNVFELDIVVLQDFEQPLMDVLINAAHIRNGDWVKNNPLIEIFIFDNNKFRPIADTSGTLLYYQACETCEFSRLYFEDARVNWFTVNDTLKIDFSPGKLTDGIYAIRIISQDNAGNKVSETPFELSFEIKNQKKVEVQGPYPNPVLNVVQFKFAFSGEVPTDLTLEIYDVKGGLVKVFTPQDYTLFRVGKMGGWLQWDMANENENQLPQGLYFYLFKGASDFSWDGDKSGKLMLVK